MSSLDRVPVFLNKRIFRKVFQIAEISKLSKEEKAMYDSNLKAKWDYENSIEFAKEEAAEQAGHKKALEIARKMKENGIPMVQIALFTALSVDEIEML